MANSLESVAAAIESRSPAAGSPAGFECDLLRGSHGVSVAAIATRLSQVEERLYDFLALAASRTLATDSRRLAPASALRGGQRGRTIHYDYGQPVDGYRRRRGQTRLRYDAAKKITGCKRHLVVDTLGLIIAVVVHGAYWQDYEGACYLLMKVEEVGPRIQRVFADSADGRNGWPDWVRETFGWMLQTVLRPAGASGFVV